MKDMIDGGAIGEIRLFRAIWLTDEFTDPLTPFDWRFDRRLGGTTIADLGSHLFDMGRWLVGDIDQVVAQSETFVRERPDAEGGAPVAVTVDDSSSVLVRFGSGVLADHGLGDPVGRDSSAIEKFVVRWPTGIEQVLSRRWLRLCARGEPKPPCFAQ